MPNPNKDEDLETKSPEESGTEGQSSFLEMSDEEMLNAAPPTVSAEVEEKTPPAEKAEKDDETDAAEEDGDKPDDEAAEGESDKGGEKDTKVADTEDRTEKAPKDDKPKETQEEKSPAIDYEAEYKRLIAPFKANGRDIQVNSVDDAIALMQMGANYNKKMAALKPNLKLMKMLENNGLLSEDKLSFLIDLDKKDPGAISKLVKDSGVDPMDLDAEKASGYKRTTYAVDEREIDLDTVLDELQETSTYNQLINVVGNKWDVASKQTVSQNPQVLKVLNDHMASGIYDLITAEVERERVFGRLKGLSDIEAYRHVGDTLNAQGKFNHLFNKQVETKPQPEVVKPKAKPVDDDSLKDKRRAASPTKSAAPSSGLPKDFNPLGMSDEEISKLAAPKFN